MAFSTVRTYLKVLSRQKVYTFVSVVGFAVSLTFVIILSVYARSQASVDSFHRNKDRLFLLASENSSSNSNPTGEWIRERLPEVETYSRVYSIREQVGVSEHERYTSLVMYADPDFFTMFSFPLTHGDPDGVLSYEESAVLSQSAARRIFGEDNPVGKTVVADGKTLTVTGVMRDFPDNTHFEAADVVVPYTLTRLTNDDLLEWGNCNYNIYFLGREKSDLPSKAAMLLEEFKEFHPIYKRGLRHELRFIPVSDIYFSGIEMSSRVGTRSGDRDTTWLYFGIAMLILVIAVLNYVNMTVAQAAFRGREAAVRKLMGSDKWGIIRQMLTETLIMTSAALALAILLAFMVQPYFSGLLGQRIDLAGELGSPAGIAVMVAFLVVISLLSGIIPALAVSSFRPIEVVKGTFSRRVKTGYSKVLIVFQFAVCTVLLICTFFMAMQNRYVRDKDLGFNKENMLVLDNYDTRLMRSQIEAVKDRISNIPGVDKIALASGSPFDGGNNNWYEIDGRRVSLQILRGDSAYVDMLGLRFPEIFPVQAGEASSLVYANRAAVNAIQPDSATWQFHGWRDNAFIGGIMEDVHVRSLHSPIVPTIFYYLSDDADVWNILVKISSDNVYETGARIREIFSDAVGGVHFEWFFSDDELMGWYEKERQMTGILGAFTLLSIVIMVMGVFAMSLYMIRQKEKEIGIRKVSGATVGEVLRLLNLQSLARVGIAIVVSFPLAYYFMGRWLQNFAYRIDLGAGGFILGGVVVTALCLVSVSWQTLNAARANPVESLKSE